MSPISYSYITTHRELGTSSLSLTWPNLVMISFPIYSIKRNWNGDVSLHSAPKTVSKHPRKSLGFGRSQLWPTRPPTTWCLHTFILVSPWIPEFMMWFIPSPPFNETSQSMVIWRRLCRPSKMPRVQRLKCPWLSGTNYWWSRHMMYPETPFPVRNYPCRVRHDTE